MIARLIRLCKAKRIPVLLAIAMIAVWGLWAMLRTPLDAIPDLSDVQVIVRTSYPGQAPQIVEDQVTYPLARTMLSVPGAKTVRGYSMFGDSFVYILFEDGTDLYFASVSSRVLEYLNQVQARLPKSATTALGPDATGVGWVYEYALVDRSHRLDVSQLRALQDWFLKYELKSVPNVAEVASLGGMVRQYQVVLDPQRLRAFGITHDKVIAAIQNANQETGGSVLELAEAEYMVRASGYLKSLEDFRKIPLATTDAGVPVRLEDVAQVQFGPEMRRGITDLDGEGEVAAGVIIMRSGKNALETINAVKAKLAQLKSTLPPGVEIVPTYDRSGLIKRASGKSPGQAPRGVPRSSRSSARSFFCTWPFGPRSNCVAALGRADRVPRDVLPGGQRQHHVTRRHRDRHRRDGGRRRRHDRGTPISIWKPGARAHPGRGIADHEHWQLIGDAAVQVGPALFTSLLIITVSFVPVFTLQAQEGRLFSPLAFTKTYAMASAAGLAVTLIPVLMGYLIHGPIPREASNPINRGLIRLCNPPAAQCARFPEDGAPRGAAELARRDLPRHAYRR